MTNRFAPSLWDTYREERMVNLEDGLIHGFHHFTCNTEREFLIIPNNLWSHNQSRVSGCFTEFIFFFEKWASQVFDGIHQRSWWKTYGRVCKVAERIP